MRAVNLLPSDAYSRSSLSRLTGVRTPGVAGLIALIGGMVVLGALAAAFVIFGGKEAEKRKELEQRQVVLSLTPIPAPPDAPQNTALAAQQASRREAVSGALARRVSWDRLLRRFSLVLPEDVWLKTLDLKSPSAGTGTAGAAEQPQDVTIAGYTYSHNSVARLLARLRLLPELDDVQLQSSTKGELGTRRVVEFQIVAGVRPEGPSS
jgi:Tfp pilus assembly protein PilN